MLLLFLSGSLLSRPLRSWLGGALLDRPLLGRPLLGSLLAAVRVGVVGLLRRRSRVALPLLSGLTVVLTALLGLLTVVLSAPLRLLAVILTALLRLLAVILAALLGLLTVILAALLGLLAVILSALLRLSGLRRRSGISLLLPGLAGGYVHCAFVVCVRRLFAAVSVFISVRHLLSFQKRRPAPELSDAGPSVYSFFMLTPMYVRIAHAAL